MRQAMYASRPEVGGFRRPVCVPEFGNACLNLTHASLNLNNVSVSAWVSGQDFEIAELKGRTMRGIKAH